MHARVLVLDWATLARFRAELVTASYSSAPPQPTEAPGVGRPQAYRNLYVGLAQRNVLRPVVVAWAPIRTCARLQLCMVSVLGPTWKSTRQLRQPREKPRLTKTGRLGGGLQYTQRNCLRVANIF